MTNMDTFIYIMLVMWITGIFLILSPSVIFPDYMKPSQRAKNWSIGIVTILIIGLIYGWLVM